MRFAKKTCVFAQYGTINLIPLQAKSKIEKLQSA